VKRVFNHYNTYFSNIKRYPTFDALSRTC
jgi:hypothetical protein